MPLRNSTGIEKLPIYIQFFLCHIVSVCPPSLFPFQHHFFPYFHFNICTTFHIIWGQQKNNHLITTKYFQILPKYFLSHFCLSYLIILFHFCGLEYSTFSRSQTDRMRSINRDNYQPICQKEII